MIRSAIEPAQDEASNFGSRACIALLLLIIAGSFALRLAYMPAPYADRNSKSDGIAASTYMVSRNYLRYGYAETRGLQVLNAQETDPSGWVTYPNHPATFVLLQSLVFQVTGGESLWAARLAPLLAVIGQLLLIYRLVQRKYPRPIALTSVALYAMWPMSLLYAGHPNYEPFCILSMLVFVDRWLAKKPGQACMAAFVGGLFDFTSFYPPFFLAVWGLLDRWSVNALGMGKAFKQAFILGIPCVSALTLHFAHISLTQQGENSLTYIWELLRQAGSRDSAWAGEIVGFTWPAFLSSQTSFLLAGFGLLGIVLSGFGFLRKAFPPGTPLLAFCGLAHILVFRYHAHVHEFWAVYLAAPMAMAAGPGLIAMRDLVLPHAQQGRRLAFCAAILALATIASAARYLNHQSNVDYRAAQVWADTLVANLPGESIALLLRQESPLPRGIECLSGDLAVWGYLAPGNKASIDLMAAHFREYQLQNRRVFVILEEQALREFQADRGDDVARRYLETDRLRGLRQDSFTSADGSLTFHCWDVTAGLFR